MVLFFALLSKQNCLFFLCVYKILLIIFFLSVISRKVERNIFHNIYMGTYQLCCQLKLIKRCRKYVVFLG